MELSKFSLDALINYITGDESPSPRRSGNDIVKFFNNFGIRDIYDYKNGGLPNSLSRKDYTYKILNELNGTAELRSIIEALVDNRFVNDSLSEIILGINKIIKYDGYILEENSANIYKVSGAEVDDEIDVSVYFKEIKSQILQSIKDAKYTIWVAVAWFTDKDLGNELLNKHNDGVNVQVIVNDDETTNKYGLDFNTKNIEYYKVSPSSKWGKKIMHNKFCIIDLKKVIHGSYNWTSNAQYHSETITITEGRDLAEDFSLQFIQLKKLN